MIIPKNIKQLEIYFRKEKMFDLLGINRIGIFGSFARNEHFNDIDILIEEDVNASQLISFRDKVSKDFNLPIDIVLSKYAEPIILFRAKKDIQYASR